MASGRRAFTEVAGVSGTVTVSVRTRSDQEWTISQVSTRCSAAPIGARCDVAVNGDHISKMLPAGDVASGDPPIIIGPSDTMTVTWQSLTAGAVCNVTVIYDDGN